MAVHVVRLGDSRDKGKGILFGTIRFQPMFTVKKEMPYDVWLPELAPSRELLKKFRDSDTMTWESFERKYRSEMKNPTPKLTQAPDRDAGGALPRDRPVDQLLLRGRVVLSSLEPARSAGRCWGGDGLRTRSVTRSASLGSDRGSGSLVGR